MNGFRTVMVALRWEWFRISRRPGFHVIMGMIAAAVVLILLGTALLRGGDYGAGPSAFPFLIFLALTVVGPFLALFLTAFAFSGEYGWGTLRAMQARGMPGWQVILSKMLLASIVLTIVWIVSWSLSVVVGLIIGDPDAPLSMLPFAEDDLSWADIASLYFGNLLAPIAYMSLTVLLCVTGRSATFGLTVTSAILIAESTAYPVAALIVETVYDFNLWDYLRWTLRGATSGLAGRYDDINAWYFVPVVLAYIGLFCCLTFVTSGKRDLESGNG